MKQYSLFPIDSQKNINKKYSDKYGVPIYTPNNIKPHISELCDKTKTQKLINEISASNLPIEEKTFLIDAARRHNVFNYEKIADYYAHASPEMQNYMEKSLLVLIDFDKALQLGFIKLCDEIKSLYMEEYEK